MMRQDRFTEGAQDVLSSPSVILSGDHARSGSSARREESGAGRAVGLAERGSAAGRLRAT